MTDVTAPVPKTLTQDAIRNIIELDTKDTKRTTFVVQVIEVKLFTQEDHKKKIKMRQGNVVNLIRLTLSDGVSKCMCMMTDQIYQKLSQEIELNHILRFKGKDVSVKPVQNINVFTFREAPEILVKATSLVGMPRNYHDNKTSQDFSAMDSLEIPFVSTPSKSHAAAEADDTPFTTATKKGMSEEDKEEDKPMIVTYGSFTPIKSLNTFLYDWKIQARVTKKHELKTWKKSTYEGCLFNIDLIDEHGTQIQATFFNDQARAYYDKLKENTVYVFSNGQIKMANKKYTSINNDFTIIFGENCSIEDCPNNHRIRGQGFSFVNIAMIEKYEKMRTIDIIGVVTEKTPLTEINLRNGQVKDRRNITLADDSGCGIQISLWSQNAIKDDYKIGDILAIRGARVSDFGGRSLNSGEEHSRLYVNPEHDRTVELQKWKKGKVDLKTEMITQSSNPHSNTEKSDSLRLIAEIQTQIEEDQTIGMDHNAHNSYFRISGFIAMLKNDDKAYYNACPDCKKKVTEEGNGYRCENCGMFKAGCVPTYMVTAKVQDHSGSVYVAFTRELADLIMGMTADEFKKFKAAATPDQVEAHFLSRLFKAYTIVIKVRRERGLQDATEMKVRYFSIKVANQSFRDENKMLLRQLIAFQSMSIGC